MSDYIQYETNQKDYQVTDTPEEKDYYVKDKLINSWDFVGFNFGEYHSITDLNIYRTSNGSRFETALNPELTEKTATVPGLDGVYYFYTNAQQKQFTVNFAFDRLTEEKLELLKKVFNGKEIKDLIFDEQPYKVWPAKVTGSSMVKYICFDEISTDLEAKDSIILDNLTSETKSNNENNERPQRINKKEDGSTSLITYNTSRVYRGEGSIQFTCYCPYAHSPKNKKILSDYNDNFYMNKNEWAAASNLPVEDYINVADTEEQVEKTNISNERTNIENTQKQLLNCGNIPSDFILTNENFVFDGSTDGTEISIAVKTANNSTINLLNITISIPAGSKYQGLKWDSKTGLVYSKINQSINFEPIMFEGNSFGKLPVTSNNFDKNDYIIFECSGISASDITIDYDYWYM